MTDPELDRLEELAKTRFWGPIEIRDAQVALPQLIAEVRRLRALVEASRPKRVEWPPIEWDQ